MNFTSKKQNQSEGPKKNSLNISWGRIFIGFTLALVVLAIIGYGCFQCKSFYDRVSQSKDEIFFALNHPNLVRAMREQYESRQAKLEDDFTRQEKSSQDKLIDEVVGKLQATDPTPSGEEPTKSPSKH